MVELGLEMARRLSHALSDGLPDDAKHHLLNAQRELITALVIVYEHQAGVRRAEFPAARAAAATRRKAAPPKSRSARIPVD